MKRFLLSLLIGGAAGVLDCIPMLLQKMDVFSLASAFAQWLVLGVIINYTVCGLRGWLKGALFALATAVPVMLLVAKTDPLSLIPMAVTSFVLGAVVGLVSARVSPAVRPQVSGLPY